MNYFPFHVGDYAAATAHLSWDEDMAYTRLLRAYYLTEQPIPLDKAYRLARATTPAQRKAVDSVLAEFFVKSDTGYQQTRCNTEIARFQGKAEAAKRSANARWKTPPNNSERNANASQEMGANAMRTHSDGNANHNQEPITNNQIPGIQSFVAKDVSVGIPPHTLFSEEFQTAAKSRPDLDIGMVWSNFNNHYPTEKRTVSRWTQWLKTERATGFVQAVNPAWDAAEITRKERDRDMAGTKPPSDEMRKQLAELTQNLKKKTSQGASV